MDNKIPNYSRIYSDIINFKYPDRKHDCKTILNKQKLSVFDILELNRKIFGNHNKESNQKYRSYNKSTILEILSYQKRNRLNNSQLALHFKLSRNTVAKWKKIFL